METVITLIVVLAILSLAVWYIVSQKRKGNKCIGCPHSKTCDSKNCPSKK